MVMTTWTQRGLAELCSSGLPVLCITDTHHRRTGRGGGVVSAFVFLEPLPLHVKLGNLLVAQVLAEFLRPPPLLFTCSSSGLPVLCSSVHIPNASPRRAWRHARGAECGVTPA